MPGGKLVEDGGEIALHHGGVDTAQPVIGAEFHYRGVGTVAQRPVQAGKSAGRRVARDGGIDQADVVAVCMERGGKLGLKALIRRQAVTRGERIPQNQQPDRGGRGVGNGGGAPSQARGRWRHAVTTGYSPERSGGEHGFSQSIGDTDWDERHHIAAYAISDTDTISRGDTKPFALCVAGPDYRHR